jgi:hypothetical protein
VTFSLEDTARALQVAGFATEQWTLSLGADDDLPTPAMLWAEHRDFLAAVTAIDAWAELDGVAEDLVAAVAAHAERLDPSPRIWDLTVIVLVRSSLSAEDRETAVPWATETRYARRVLAVGVTSHSLQRALAPILPLVVSPTERPMAEPSALLLQALADSVGADLAEAAVRSFEATGRIEL